MHRILRRCRLYCRSGTQGEQMSDGLKTDGWWQTVPGMLTATAGIITAVAGLLVALHQVGLLGGKETPAAQTSRTATSESLNDTAKPSVSASMPGTPASPTATAA